MKAIYFERHGGPDVLRFGDRPIPEPGADQVLIEVHAAAVNPRDWQFRDGTYAFRHLSGRLPIIAGSDVSGVVVQRGHKVTNLEVGDEVFAMQTTLGKMGGFAEYIAIHAGVVARKPASISHVEAAAVPVAGMTAWQALHDLSKVRAGMRVAVVGASGGVGHYAVQIARHAGAVVTGICGQSNIEFVRGLGAENVIDHTTTQFTDVMGEQDVVFDTIGRESLATCAPVLTPAGAYLTTNPTIPAAAEWARTALTQRVLGGRRAQLVLVRPRLSDLNAIATLMATGHIRSVVEDTYPLENAGDALEKSRRGHARAKLVLKIR
jgi:NADPH:quinone reductase-like Zn-dependent oxidoreductase